MSPYDLSRALVRVAGTLLWGVRIRGAGNIPRRGGVILASNHQSFLDVLLVGAWIRRRTRFLARRTLWDARLLGAWMSAVGALPVDLGRPRKEEMQRVIDLLRDGEVVTLFPEGTRTKDGSIGEMRGGLALLARRAGVPVVPVLVQGAFEAWPRGCRIPRRGRVTITVGRPVEYPADWEDREVAADIRRRLLVLRDGAARPRPRAVGVGATSAPHGGGGSR